MLVVTRTTEQPNDPYCQDILVSLTELGCYCGVALSALIARRLLLMEQLTFINRILLLYFTIDAVMGVLETYFSFKLYSERLEEARMHIEIHNHFISLLVCLMMRRSKSTTVLSS